MPTPQPTQLTRLLEPIHERAMRFCRRLCTTRPDAEDLYHDAILAAWRGLPHLANPDRFGSWFFQIIINTYRNRERRKRWRRFLSWDHADDDPLGDEFPSVDPRGKLDARIRLSFALRALTADERSLVVLFELEEYPVAELAQLYNCPEGTIKSRLSRARQKMREAIVKDSAAARPATARNQEERYELHPNPQTTD